VLAKKLGDYNPNYPAELKEKIQQVT